MLEDLEVLVGSCFSIYMFNTMVIKASKIIIITIITTIIIIIIIMIKIGQMERCEFLEHDVSALLGWVDTTRTASASL